MACFIIRCQKTVPRVSAKSVTQWSDTLPLNPYTHESQILTVINSTHCQTDCFEFVTSSSKFPSTPSRLEPQPRPPRNQSSKAARKLPVPGRRRPRLALYSARQSQPPPCSRAFFGGIKHEPAFVTQPSAALAVWLGSGRIGPNTSVAGYVSRCALCALGPA